jgi:hypothetical protein
MRRIGMRRMALFLVFTGVVFAALPAHAEIEGERRYNFVTSRYEFYDGANWYNFNLGLPLGLCSNEAAWDYNTLLNLYQYCNGTNWIRLVGIPSLSFCSNAAEMDYSSGSYWYCNGLVWVNMKGSLVI